MDHTMIRYEPIKRMKPLLMGPVWLLSFLLFSLYDHVFVVPTPFVSSPNGIAPSAASSCCLYGNRSRSTILILFVCECDWFVIFQDWSFSFLLHSLRPQTFWLAYIAIWINPKTFHRVFQTPNNCTTVRLLLIFFVFQTQSLFVFQTQSLNRHIEPWLSPQNSQLWDTTPNTHKYTYMQYKHLNVV